MGTRRFFLPNIFFKGIFQGHLCFPQKKRRGDQGSLWFGLSKCVNTEMFWSTNVPGNWNLTSFLTLPSSISSTSLHRDWSIIVCKFHTEWLSILSCLCLPCRFHFRRVCHEANQFKSPEQSYGPLPGWWFPNNQMSPYEVHLDWCPLEQHSWCIHSPAALLRVIDKFSHSPMYLILQVNHYWVRYSESPQRHN